MSTDQRDKTVGLAMALLGNLFDDFDIEGYFETVLELVEGLSKQVTSISGRDKGPFIPANGR